MLSYAVQWLLFAQLFAFSVAAHWDWWLQGLPNCLQDCVANTQDGCNSRKCMCKTSESSASYLPETVACAVSACDADKWTLQLVLGPLQLYCDEIGFAIPDQAMDNAYSAASDDGGETTTTRQVQSSAQESKSKTDPPTLTSTPAPTMTTTTSSKPESDHGLASISTGNIVTSTVGGGSSHGRSHGSSAPSSTTASPSPTAQTSSPVPTEDPSSTLESGSEGTEPPASGNGSPFENMQADACRWAVSATHMILGVLLALTMGL